MSRVGIIIIIVLICAVCLIGLGVGGYFALRKGGPLNHLINSSSPSPSSDQVSDTVTTVTTVTVNGQSPGPSPSGMSSSELSSAKKTIRSSYNTCLGEDGGMYGCDPGDSKQQWNYDPSKKQLKSVSSSKCLAMYDGNNGSKPYSWDCDETDERQKWTYEVPLLKSGFGSCLAIYDQNIGSKPYGWSCGANDNRQNWNMA